MNKTMTAAALAAGVMFGYSGRVWNQTNQKLPVAGYAPAKDIPGARELPNPDVDYELKQAGVELRVCGQGLLGKKVDPKDVLPDVQVDLWAMTTMVNLQLRGYVRVGG